MSYDESPQQRVWGAWRAGASGFETLPWAEPNFTQKGVNWAGRKLVEASTATEVTLWSSAQWDEFDHAIVIINNWRAAHGYPLNTFQVNLRHSAKRFDDSPLIAQRTKRLASIGDKLVRLPKMKLTQMQDIGGCRAVVKSADAVSELQRFYLKESAIKHEPDHAERLNVAND